MPVSAPISLPAGYAPAFALGFANSADRLEVVSRDRPLPVALAASATAPEPAAPLKGEATGAAIAGPFEAVPDRTVLVSLAGDWQGTVSLRRSTDGGATLTPLMIGGMPWGEYSTSGCEQVWHETQEGASFYLDIALVSGKLAYEVSQ